MTESKVDLQKAKAASATTSEAKSPRRELRERLEELDKACAHMRQTVYDIRQLLSKS